VNSDETATVTVNGTYQSPQSFTPLHNAWGETQAWFKHCTALLHVLGVPGAKQGCGLTEIEFTQVASSP